MGAPKKQEITQKTEIPKYIKRATAGVNPSSAAFQAEQQAIKDFYGLADGGYVSAYRRGGPVFQGLGSTPQAAEAYRRFGGAFGGMRNQPAIPMGRPGRPPMQGMPGRPPMPPGPPQVMGGRPPMQGMPGGASNFAAQQRAQMLEMMKARPSTGVPTQQAVLAQGMPGRPPMPPGPPQVMGGRPPMPAAQPGARPPMPPGSLGGMRTQPALPAMPAGRPAPAPAQPGGMQPQPPTIAGRPPMPAGRPPMPAGTPPGMPAGRPPMPAGRPPMPAAQPGAHPSVRQTLASRLTPAPAQPGFANGGMVGQSFNPLDLTSPAMAYYMAQGAQGYAQGGYIEGPGTGRSDSIPATIHQNGVPVQDAALSDGEFVMTERAVRGAGNGDREAGAARMYEMMRRFEGRG